MSESSEGDDGRRARQLFDALTHAAEVAGISVTVAYLTDTGADVTYANDVALGMLDVSRDELTARSVWSYIAPDELPKLLEMHARTMRGERNPTSFQTVLIHKSGHRIPVEIATHSVLIDDRRVNVTFMTDVSVRKQAEDALVRSELLFRTLAESAPDGIAILRFPKILYANERAAQLFGLPSAQAAIGTSLLDVLTPDDARVAKERARRRIAGEQLSDTVEYTLRSGNSIEVRATPIEYEGRPATLGFARDITERKQLLARLMQSEKLAALGALAAGVAHEVNNPLAYLLLSLDMLERQLPKLLQNPESLPALMKLLADAKHGGARVKTIVRDLQTFTRRDDGEGGLVDLEKAIEAALSIAGHELRHIAQLVRRFDPDVPRVLGHAARFEQLFLNLILNALHAIEGVPPERRVIEVSLKLSPNDRVIAAVRDEGCGMSPETLMRATEPFFTTKPPGLGTGLGLSICESIAHAAGGELFVESELERGTRVKLSMPAHRGIPPERPRSITPPGTHAPRRASILIVDDERAVATSLAAALADEHDVTTCFSVAQARQKLAENDDYDVVLCDVVMPGEDGPMLLAHLRSAHPQLAERFAFMTGGASLPIAEQLRAETHAAQLEKPFELEAVHALIRRLVKQRDRAKAS